MPPVKKTTKRRNAKKPSAAKLNPVVTDEVPTMPSEEPSVGSRLRELLCEWIAERDAIRAAEQHSRHVREEFHRQVSAAEHEVERAKENQAKIAVAMRQEGGLRRGKTYFVLNGQLMCLDVLNGLTGECTLEELPFIGLSQ